MTDWDVPLYRRFEDERTRPAADLLAAVSLTSPKTVVDLGCGPANSTELLARRFPNADILGVDTSPAMIEAARARLPGARFELGDAATFQPDEPVDLLFSNAVMHWVPDHARLYPRLMSCLSKGGVLAIQVPDNLAEDTHTLMQKAARDAGFSDVVAAAESERTPIGSFEDHWNWLAPHAARVDLWRTTYVHPLSGADGIVAWLTSTGLRPYLSRLDEADGATFRAHYHAEISRAYPPQAEGKVLLRFPRLFVVAVHA